jgi:hypothetical protein
MENLKVATRANRALKSTRPAKRQKTSSYPDKMWLVLELVYMKVLQQKLVQHMYTGHNSAEEVIDQIYDTAYSCAPDVMKTGCVCKNTKGLLEKYVASEQKRILSSKFTWMSVIKEGVNLCYAGAYNTCFFLCSSKQGFFPMDKWMPSFNFMRHTLSFNGRTFGTLHVTRMMRRKKKGEKITSHFLVAKLTVSTSDDKHVDFEPFVVEVDKMWWEESLWDSEEHVNPPELMAWLGKQNRDINRYVVGQARDFFQCS